MHFNRLRYFLVLIAILIASSNFGQSQTDTLFIKTIGGIAEDVGYDATVCSDNTVLICGSTSSFGVGATDVYLVKTDSLGEILWSKTFGYENVEIGKEVIEVSNKEIVLTGYTNSNGANGYDILLMKLDSLGETKWIKQYGGSDWEFGNSLCNKNNNGLIVAGEKYGTFGDKDIYYFATNNDGNVIWEKTISADGEDHAARLKQTLDGNFVLAGNTSTTTDSSQAYLVKFKENGDTLWTKTFGYSGNEYIHDIATANDSGFVLVGSTNSTLEYDLDLWIVKLDKNGIFIWDRILGHSIDVNIPNQNDEVIAVDELSSGRLAIMGYTKTWGSENGKDITADIYTYDGWSYNNNAAAIGTIFDDEPFSVAALNNNNFIATGRTNGSGNGLYDLLFFVCDSVASLPKVYESDLDNPTTNTNNIKSVVEFYSIPNPLTPHNIESLHYPLTNFYDLSGKKINITHLFELQSGAYIAEVKLNNSLRREKIIWLNE